MASAGLLGSIFAVLVVLGALRPRWHTGFLAIAVCFALAPFSNETLGLAVTPARHFPAALFVKLVGISLFFGALERNGTLERVLGRALHRLRGQPLLVPIVFFAVPALLVTSGVGNIAAVALLAPIALRSAELLRIPAVAMSVLVVGAANAAAFSPLSIAGVIVSDALAARSHELDLVVSTGLRWAFFWRTFLVQAGVCVLGFAALGGVASLRRAALEAAEARASLDPDLDEEELPPEVAAPPPFAASQVRSVLAFVAFVGSTMLFGSRAASLALPAPVCATFADPGTLGFLGLALLMICGDADVDDVIRHAPWSALFLVCGMMTFLEWAAALGALDTLTTRMLAVATPRTLPFGLAFAAAALSAVSSSTGVVLPLMLPMLPELHAHVPEVPVVTMLASIGIGAHLVDASPLSTLGALCVSNVADSAEQTRLFRSLLLWGLAMVPLAAVLCALLALPILRA